MQDIQSHPDNDMIFKIIIDRETANRVVGVGPVVADISRLTDEYGLEGSISVATLVDIITTTVLRAYI